MLVLRRLYRSELCQDEEDSPIFEELIQAREAFAARRENLMGQLDEPTCEKLEALLTERLELSELEKEDAYIRGMKLGALITMELLDDTEYKKTAHP